MRRHDAHPSTPKHNEVTIPSLTTKVNSTTKDLPVTKNALKTQSWSHTKSSSRTYKSNCQRGPKCSKMFTIVSAPHCTTLYNDTSQTQINYLLKCYKIINDNAHNKEGTADPEVSLHGKYHSRSVKDTDPDKAETIWWRSAQCPNVLFEKLKARVALRTCTTHLCNSRSKK